MNDEKRWVPNDTNKGEKIEGERVRKKGSEEVRKRRRTGIRGKGPSLPTFVLGLNFHRLNLFKFLEILDIKSKD